LRLFIAISNAARRGGDRDRIKRAFQAPDNSGLPTRIAKTFEASPFFLILFKKGGPEVMESCIEI